MFPIEGESFGESLGEFGRSSPTNSALERRAVGLERADIDTFVLGRPRSMTNRRRRAAELHQQLRHVVQ